MRPSTFCYLRDCTCASCCAHVHLMCVSDTHPHAHTETETPQACSMLTDMCGVAQCDYPEGRLHDLAPSGRLPMHRHRTGKPSRMHALASHPVCMRVLPARASCSCVQLCARQPGQARKSSGSRTEMWDADCTAHEGHTSCRPPHRVTKRRAHVASIAPRHQRSTSRTA